MTLEQSVQRLQWRFNTNKSFKPNQNDANALNFIFGWITRQKDINALNNDLFAKLYILQLNKTIREYDSTVFDEMIQKEVSRVLSIPLDRFYESFYNDLHHNQIKKVSLQKEFTLDDVKERFTKEIVKDKLQHMVTEAINRFS